MSPSLPFVHTLTTAAAAPAALAASASSASTSCSATPALSPEKQQVAVAERRRVDRRSSTTRRSAGPRGRRRARRSGPGRSTSRASASSAGTSLLRWNGSNSRLREASRSSTVPTPSARGAQALVGREDRLGDALARSARRSRGSNRSPPSARVAAVVGRPDRPGRGVRVGRRDQEAVAVDAGRARCARATSWVSAYGRPPRSACTSAYFAAALLEHDRARPSGACGCPCSARSDLA